MKVFLIVLLTSLSALATKPKLPPLLEVQGIFAKYWASDSVFMQVNKKSIMGLLGSTSDTNGRLLFAKGKLRIDFVEPEKSTIIFNDKKIILIKNVKQGLTDKRLITYISKAKVQRQNALMGLLFGDKKVWSKLQLTDIRPKKDLVSLFFKPKGPDDLPGVIKVAIVYDQATREIRAIKQWDDSENEVQFVFSSMLFDIPFKKNYFSYQPKKGDEINEL